METHGRTDRRRARSAIALAEVLICLALVSTVLIPLLALLFKGRQAAFKTRMSLLALQVAREEIDDTKVLGQCLPGDPRQLSHPWRPISGSPLDRLVTLAAEVGRLPAVSRPYPPAYLRILTRLRVEGSPDPRIFPSCLELFWQEEGEPAPPAGHQVGASFQRFDFIIVRSKVRRP